MSNIYIQEPATSAKVLLKTTVGDIDIELWAKECPKASRNFIQLCMEGYYNNTIFHRVVKGFIVQGGDPNGDGTGGESIYGEPFKDEFHTRLRYARRGLLGMANSDTDDNGSQFFFTMAPTPELQNKNTLFGKVTGDTIFNMLKLEEGLVDHNERPMYPNKILAVTILNNPFPDIEPRILMKQEKKEATKTRMKGVKNFVLLSFGEEAEEDEEESNNFAQKNAGKSKSMHDVVDDPQLSKTEIKIKPNNDDTLPDDNVPREDDNINDKNDRIQRIKDRLKSKLSHSIKKEPDEAIKAQEEEDYDLNEDLLKTHEEQKRLECIKKKDEIRQEIHSLKKQYQMDKKSKDDLLQKKIEKDTEKVVIKEDKDNELIKHFVDTKLKYTGLTSKLPKKGANREEFTLNLLSKFRAKLDALKQKGTESEEVDAVTDDGVVEKAIQGDEWLTHSLKFSNSTAVLAKDASTKGDDWYGVYDPRNPLNKRKRGESNKDKPSDKKRVK